MDTQLLIGRYDVLAADERCPGNRLPGAALPAAEVW